MKAFKPLTLVRWILPVCFFFLMSPLHSLVFGNSQSQTSVQQEQVVNLTISPPSLLSDKSEPVKAQLVAEKKGIEPGKSFWVAIRLDMAPDWSTYWVNPGDIGMPTQVNWHLPPGFKAGPLKWPYPEKSVHDGFVKYGYSGTVYLLTEITPPQNLTLNSTVDVKADVTWVACSDSCVPGKANLSLSLPVNKIDSLNSDPEVAQAKDELPAPSAQYHADVTASLKDKEIICNIAFSNTSGKVKDVTFYPTEGSLINDSAQQNWKSNGKNLTLTLEPPADAPTSPDHLKGILLISSEHQGSLHEQAVEVNVPLAASAAPASQSSSEVNSIGLALVFAFFGGLILNVMPCVLPVIALKIFGFVKLSQQKRSAILKHGGIFALGVLISFWVLSGILLILRSYGEGIGWGFQLQEPMFVIILTLVLFVLGLSLLGVFELGSSLMGLGQRTKPSSSPLLGTLSSGVLATLVATPCTGPLLGPALGFAMTLSPISALAVFTVMGLGMASPYLLFSAFPSLVKFLPKPGNWMITFKQIMGFLMMATVVWLLWVFGAQTDSFALIAVLGSLLIISIGAWIFGHWQLPTKRRWVRWTATSIAALLIGFGSFISFTFAKMNNETPSKELVQNVSYSSENGWENFSAQRIDELRKEGKPVFVDFTAKWCLICQANKVALNSDEITKSFNKLGVIKMRADWTKNDPLITHELQKFGRTGVPLYVLYPADPAQKPYILPQTLTKSIVNEYLSKLHTGPIQEATVYVD